MASPIDPILGFPLSNSAGQYGRVTQLGIVTFDIDKAVDAYVAAGIGVLLNSFVCALHFMLLCLRAYCTPTL